MYWDHTAKPGPVTLLPWNHRCLGSIEYWNLNCGVILLGFFCCFFFSVTTSPKCNRDSKIVRKSITFKNSFSSGFSSKYTKISWELNLSLESRQHDLFWVTNFSKLLQTTFAEFTQQNLLFFFLFWLPVLEIQLGEFSWIISHWYTSVQQILCQVKSSFHRCFLATHRQKGPKAMSQPEPPQQGCWVWKQAMLTFHAHAGTQMLALSSTIIHSELSLMLQVSSLTDFSPAQRELPLCWLNTASRRKREAKINKNILLSPSYTKYHYIKTCSWWFLGQTSLPPLSALLQQTNLWDFSPLESWQDWT